MTGSPERPKLRADLQVSAADINGHAVYVIRDGIGLIKEPVALDRSLTNLLKRLDGAHTPEDIERELSIENCNEPVTIDEINGVIRRLDELMILDSPGFQDRRTRLIQEFATLGIRQAALANESYPSNPTRLRNKLDRILSENPSGLAEHSASLRALVAPHIDIDSGRKGYAAAYVHLRNATRRLVILLGTGHAMESGLLSLTEKDFETPLGRTRTDRELMRRLRDAAGPAAAPDDFAHRLEHSLEFQVLFLQHLLGPENFTLAPILCGSLADHLPAHAGPHTIPGLSGALAILKKTFDQAPSEVLVVAGVDLSHIGPKFGHDQPASALMADAREHDQALLAALCAGDRRAFWAESQRVSDRFNVCGFSALACLMEIVPALKGTQLHYQAVREPATQSAVTIAAAAFHE